LPYLANSTAAKFVIRKFNYTLAKYYSKLASVMELSSKSQSTTAQVFGYSGLSICVLNDSLLIRSLLSLSLVRTIWNSLISLTHHFYDWHPGSRCGWTCNQL